MNYASIFIDNKKKPSIGELFFTSLCVGAIVWYISIMLFSVLHLINYDVFSPAPPHKILFSLLGFIVWIVGSSLFLMIQALSFLKNGNFVRVKYFWLLFTPIVNSVFIVIISVYAYCKCIQEYIYRHVEYYKKASEKEFENVLQNTLDHTIKMNDKIKHMKNSCNTKTDELIIKIMEASQETLNIVRGN